MANIIMVITNEEYISKVQVTNLLDYDEFSIIPAKSFDISDGLVNSTVSIWKEINSEEDITKFISITDCSNTYNIVFLPLAGLLFTLAKDRANNNNTDRYIIVEFKEQYRSCLVDRGLFNVYIDSRTKLTPTIIKELFDSIDSNILLSPEYDQLVELTKTLYAKPNHALISDKIQLYMDMTSQ